MSGKSIIIGAVAVLIIIVGGYFIFTNYSSPEPSQEQTSGALDEVQVQDITAGSGAEAVPGSVVSVLYVGMLEDGTVFDSSEAYDNEPLTFVLGDPGLIAGFQIGINGMREGGERVMVVPPKLGYGVQEVRDEEGNLIIPANASLIFNVRLLGVAELEGETSEEGEDNSPQAL